MRWFYISFFFAFFAMTRFATKLPRDLLFVVFGAIYLLSFIGSSQGMRLPFKSSHLSVKSIPNQLTSDVPNTWAHDTMSRRIRHEIFPRIIEDNRDELTRPTSPLRSECLLILNDLASSLESGSTGYLRGISDSGPDLAIWDDILRSVPDEKRNWLQAPWAVTEFYFYRRVVEAFRYFETGYDMFSRQKVAGLLDSIPFVDQLAGSLPSLLKSESRETALEAAFLTSLWGNKVDLSLWPKTGNAQPANAGKGNEGGQISIGSTLKGMQSFILDNQLEEVLAYLDRVAKSGPCRIDIIVDNAGYELVSDLVLAHCLLSLGVADQVVLHTKKHPTFVSDATTSDVVETINFLTSMHENSAISSFGSSLGEYLKNGGLIPEEDLFWCQPLAFWDMPEYIVNKLQGSKLVVVKGDANYRRLLGDCAWPLDTSSKDILSYWPVPVVALRALKAELGCGLSANAVQFASEKDSKWLVSGKWAVVQFYEG